MPLRRCVTDTAVDDEQIALTEIRLSKLMAARGICSRREADRFIEQGLVSVDGNIVTTLGTRILESQTISLHQRARQQQAMLMTVLINKPLGYVSGLPEKGYSSAVMLIDHKNRHNMSDVTPKRHAMAPAGRLDIDSTGLMVFTQDGRIAKMLIGADSVIEKEYLVRVSGNITDSKMAQLRHGLMLDDKRLKPAHIENRKEDELKFILIEGRKRQIRRMCEQVDLPVTRLKRIRIGNIKLGNLGRGKWRLLHPDERF